MPREAETYSVDLDEDELRRILNETDDFDDDDIGRLDEDDLDYLK